MNFIERLEFNKSSSLQYQKNEQFVEECHVKRMGEA